MDIVQHFDNSEVRFVDHPEGKYEFGIVAADLAAVLNAEENGHKFTRSVDDEWLGVHNVDTNAGKRTMTVIWEPGVYQLLAKSRKHQY